MELMTEKLNALTAGTFSYVFKGIVQKSHVKESRS